MAEKYGIEKLKSYLVDGVVPVMNIGSQIVHGQWWKIVSLQGPISLFGNFDFEAVKKELSDLSEAEREDLEKSFQNGLSLVNKEVQQKFVESVDALEQAIDLVEEAVLFVEENIEKGQALYEKFKKIVGVV